MRLSTLGVVRLSVQIVVLLSLHAKLFGLPSASVIVPFLHPTGAPYSVVHGVLESFEFTLTHSVFPFLPLGVLLITAVTLGKLLCGWACPFGLVQDVLSLLPVPHRPTISRKTLGRLTPIKYGVVGLVLVCTLTVSLRRSAALEMLQQEGRDLPEATVAMLRRTLDAPFGDLSDAPFNLFNPSSTLFAYLPYLILYKPMAIVSAGLTGWVKLLSLLGVLFVSALVPRAFCRFACPVGAAMDPLAAHRIVHVGRDKTKMTRDEANKVLDRVCPTGVQQGPGEEEMFESSLCNHCGNCVVSSPHIRQSISF